MAKSITAGILTLIFAFATSPAFSQEFIWAPDLPVGAVIPEIKALDQDGETRNLASLTGEKGLLLMFSRSFDWCPFCIRQLNQLVEINDRFAALGIGIATITYDPVQFLNEYAEDEGILFALLHDEGAHHVKAFGILNTDYEPGERAYGIPYPGIFLLDTSGAIRYKFAEQSYRIRPDFEEVLAAAAKM